MAFEDGDRVYMSDGTEVQYVAKINEMHVVREVLYGLDGDEMGLGALKEERIVWQEPPTTRQHAEIERLEVIAADLTSKLNTLRAEKAKLEDGINATKASCAKHAAIQHVVDAIEGKITHFVVVRYNGVTIMTKDDALKPDDFDREFAGGKLKLLTLYGSSKGNLQWNLNRWCDGSGCNIEAYPCFSMEEARITAQRLINELGESEQYHVREQAVKSALALGLVPPAIAKATMDARALQDAEEEVRRSELSLARSKAALAALLPKATE